MAPVPAEAVRPLRLRWERLADMHAPVVRLLPPGAGVTPEEESVAVPPGLAEVVDVLPGIAVGAVVVDWPQAASQQWPELEARHTYQPVWADGRAAVVVRIDPVSGAAGEVVQVVGDAEGSVRTLAGDAVTWWESFTEWAERALVDLVEELRSEVEDEEELQALLEEALDQEFTEWLNGRG